MILVYRYRVKSLNGLLNKQSRAVNYVWNFCNDTQKHALKWGKKWPTGFDLNVLTTGSSKELGIHSGTVNATCEQYAKSRSQHRRPYLRYRGRKSLGWVPLKGRDLKREGDAFRFAGNTFRVFNSRPLPEGKIKDGTNFAQDARGNWFLNIAIEMPDVQARPIRSGVGIDLGLKDFATLSTGEKLPNDRFGRRAAEKLAKAQAAYREAARQGRECACRFPTQARARSGAAFRLHRGWQRICRQTCQNQDGEERLRRILVVLPKHAPLQGDGARSHVRGSRRKRFDPVLFVVRIERQHDAAERYRGTANKRVGLQ